MDAERPGAWWDEVEAAALLGDPPDPWAALETTLDGENPALTADQEAFLAALEDQPWPPRLTGLTAPGPESTEPTGSLPGDNEIDGS